MRKIIFCMFIGTVAVLRPSLASADLNICNTTCGDIWVAAGEEYFSNHNRDFVTGWYFTKPGQCATPIIGDVCFWWANVFGNCSDDILAFGEDADGHRWGGSRAICTTQSAFFDQPPQYNPSNGPCAPGRSTLFWFEYNYSHASDVTINLLCP